MLDGRQKLLGADHGDERRSFEQNDDVVRAGRQNRRNRLGQDDSDKGVEAAVAERERSLMLAGRHSQQAGSKDLSLIGSLNEAETANGGDERLNHIVSACRPNWIPEEGDSDLDLGIKGGEESPDDDLDQRWN